MIKIAKKVIRISLFTLASSFTLIHPVFSQDAGAPAAPEESASTPVIDILSEAAPEQSTAEYDSGSVPMDEDYPLKPADNETYGPAPQEETEQPVIILDEKIRTSVQKSLEEALKQLGDNYEAAVNGDDQLVYDAAVAKAKMAEIRAQVDMVLKSADVLGIAVTNPLPPEDAEKGKTEGVTLPTKIREKLQEAFEKAITDLSNQYTSAVNGDDQLGYDAKVAQARLAAISAQMELIIKGAKELGITLENPLLK